MLPPLVAIFQEPALFADVDLFWYCDNQSGAAAIVKGSARAPDLARLATVAHLAWATARCRTWIEWVDSASNCADGASRAGEKDEFAAGLGVEVRTAPRFDLASVVQGSLLEALEVVMPGSTAGQANGV